MSYETLLSTMSDFLLNEPSGDFDLREDGIRLVKNNGLDEYDIKRLADTANDFDRTGKLALIHLAALCRRQIANTVAPVSSFLSCTSTLDKYRRCLECVNSQDVKNCRAELVERLAAAIGSASSKKAIGSAADVDAVLEDALESVFDEFKKLKFETYTNSGLQVGTLGVTAKSVQVCGSLAECLIRLEKSNDGIYICFITNPGTLDGWFGFFVKSNGNLFSYNERIDEEYVGQHRGFRNGRYAEHGKAYGLFPYELCEFSEETDYKGYSKEVTIGENRSLFDGENLEMAVRTFLAIALIAQKHRGLKVSGETVVVDSLLPKNLAKLAGDDSGTKALVAWQQSQLVAATANFALPRFEDDKVVRGEYDKDFNGCEANKGVFCGINQDILDAYGDGFRADYAKVLASGSSLRLIGDGDTQQEFVGTPERLRLRAYYEVRGQLAEYVWRRLNVEYEAFGGEEGVLKWYRERLEKRRDAIYRSCIDAYVKSNGGEERRVRYGDTLVQENSPSSAFASQTQPMTITVSRKNLWNKISLSKFVDRRYICAKTGAKASYFFGFSFHTYEQVRDFLKCPLPKFCTGWRSDYLYNGNSILDVTDPVGDMDHPMSGSKYLFDFTVALSKQAIRELLKVEQKKVRAK